MLLDSLYLLSLDESGFLDDESDYDDSDSSYSGTYYFLAFYMHFDDSVGSISVLGLGIFVPTGVKSKDDICVFYVFVPIRVKSKGGRLIKCFGAQIPFYLSKFETQFYSYSHGHNLHQSLQLLYFHQEYDRERSNGHYM